MPARGRRTSDGPTRSPVLSSHSRHTSSPEESRYGIKRRGGMPLGPRKRSRLPSRGAYQLSPRCSVCAFSSRGSGGGVVARASAASTAGPTRPGGSGCSVVPKILRRRPTPAASQHQRSTYPRRSGTACARWVITASLKSGRSAVRPRPWPPDHHQVAEAVTSKNVGHRFALSDHDLAHPRRLGSLDNLCLPLFGARRGHARRSPTEQSDAHGWRRQLAADTSPGAATSCVRSLSSSLTEWLSGRRVTATTKPASAPRAASPSPREAATGPVPLPTDCSVALHATP